VIEDPPLELRERLTRLQAELARELAARPLVGLQRVGLATGPVERQHQLSPYPLLERVLTNQPGQVPDQLPSLPGLQIRINPQKQRVQALLLHRAAPPGDHPLTLDIAQRLATT